jgi:hypothetical protein
MSAAGKVSEVSPDSIRMVSDRPLTQKRRSELELGISAVVWRVLPANWRVSLVNMEGVAGILKMTFGEQKELFSKAG